MDLQQFSDWLTSTGLSQSMQLSRWAIPGIQTIHILALALLFAAALIVALRFWGKGLAIEPLHPMYAGDTLYVSTEILDKRDSRSRPDTGIVTMKHIGRNQDDVICIEVTRAALFLRRPQA